MDSDSTLVTKIPHVVPDSGIKYKALLIVKTIY